MDAAQVKWVATPPNTKKYYAKEDAAIVEAWLRHAAKYLPVGENEPRPLLPYVIFHDAGTALNGCEALAALVGLPVVWVDYPPDVHELLSPNDNNLHGIAKAKWRASPALTADDVVSTLYLAGKLSSVDAKVVKGFWDKNFVLDQPLTRRRCEELVGFSKTKRAQQAQVMYDSARALYLSWINGDTRRGWTQQPCALSALPSGLDGVKWVG